MKKMLPAFILIMITCGVYAQIPTTDLRMWYKADVGFTPATWSDQSGNNNHLAADPFGAAPSQQTDGSLKYIDFSTTTFTFPFPSTTFTTMKKTSGVSWSAGSTGSTVFFVYKTNGTLAAGSAGLVLAGSPTSVVLCNIINPTTASFITGVATNNFTPSSSKQMLSGVFTPGNSTGNQLYINGALQAQVATTSILAATSISNITITSPAAPGNSSIHVYEMIVYSAPLSAADRQQVQNYLGGKYNISLPLRFVNIGIQLRNKDAVLNWETADEINTLEFVVERSTDGRNYYPAGTVVSVNTPGIHQYHFTDAAVTSLNKPVLYYRLKQKDIDGRFTYSPVVSLALPAKEKGIQIYPNPVKDNIIVKSSITYQRLEVADMSGKLLMQITRHPSHQYNISQLPAGMYILTVIGHENRETFKIIKQQ